MKKILSVVILLIFLIHQVHAYENDGTNGMSAITTGGNFENCADPDNENNTVMRFSGSSRAILFIPIEEINGGIIEISYRLRFSDQGSNIIQLPMLTSNKECLFIPQYHQGGLAINNNGTMNFFGTYHENIWYTFKYVVDTEALKYDVYVNNRKLCSDFGFTTAVLSEIDGIKLQISSGSVYIDDISVVKIGESLYRNILFNSDYKADHENMTIGSLPYHMDKEDFLKSIRLKSDTRMDLSTVGDYVCDGDILTIQDDLYGKSYNYTIKVRSLNISLNFFNTFKDSIVLNEDGSCYVNTVFHNIEGYKDGYVKKDLLLLYGVDAQSDLSINDLRTKGLYVEQWNEGYAIVRKSAFTNRPNIKKAWSYDLNKLFQNGGTVK